MLLNFLMCLHSIRNSHNHRLFSCWIKLLFSLLQFSVLISHGYGRSRLLSQSAKYTRGQDTIREDIIKTGNLNDHYSSEHDRTFKISNSLRGQTGTLRPNLAKIDSTGGVADDQIFEIPESILKTRNLNKLLISFDQQCANSTNQTQTKLLIQVLYILSRY